jgi:hypothetical protein
VTELALFHALSELKAQNALPRAADAKLFQGLKAPSAKAKNEYLEEWKQYPLHEAAKWLEYKQPLLGSTPAEENLWDNEMNVPPALGNANTFVPQQQYTNDQDFTGYSHATYNPLPQPQMEQEVHAHFRPVSSTSVPSEGRETSTASGKSRAESYAETHKNLYF